MVVVLFENTVSCFTLQYMQFYVPIRLFSSNCSDKIICSKLQVQVQSNSCGLKTRAVSKQVLAKFWFGFGLGVFWGVGLGWVFFVGGYWLL